MPCKPTGETQVTMDARHAHLCSTIQVNIYVHSASLYSLTGYSRIVSGDKVQDDLLTLLTRSLTLRVVHVMQAVF